MSFVKDQHRAHMSKKYKKQTDKHLQTLCNV